MGAETLGKVLDPGRLAALRSRFILDTPADEGFDQLARMAAKLLDVPVVLVSLVDKDRQFFKSAVGLAEPYATTRETPLSHSFCRHAVESGQPLVIPDSRRHPLVRDNPAIEDLGVAAYAGVPLTTDDGDTLGTMCAIDHKPRQWTQAEVDLLTYLARCALARIELQAVAEEAERRSEALSRREAYFRTLIEKSSDVITILDRQGIILYESPSIETVLGYGPDELVGRDCIDFVHSDDRARVRRALLGLMDNPGGHAQVEYRFRHKLGSWRTLESGGRNLLDVDLIKGVVVNSRDVTAGRSLQNQLRQAQKLDAVGQLAAGIAHDFNNVLAVVVANAQLVAQSLPAGSDELRRQLADVRAAALSGAGMIRSLMAFSRDTDLDLAPRDLTAVVADTVVMLRRLLPAQITLETELPAEECSAEVDASAMQQILMNAATNARDAMPAGGTLRVELTTTQLGEPHRVAAPRVRTGPSHCITIRDTGTGMDEATQRRLFEPFFTTKPAGKGTGLGMSMIQRLMADQGGCVHVESAPGEGTTLTLHLPALGDVAPVAETLAPAGSLEGRGETVLVVEDEEALRRATQRVLEHFGYKVVAAADGVAALVAIDAGPAPDLILVDFEMPRLDGPGLYAELRDRGVRTRFLVASGQSAARAQASFGDDAGVSVIQKPWLIEDLLRATRNALASALG